MIEEKIFNYLFDNQFKPTQEVQPLTDLIWVKEEGWEEYKLLIDMKEKIIVVYEADWNKQFLKNLMDLIEDDYRINFTWYDDKLEEKLK
jgi:hypothetical protein